MNSKNITILVAILAVIILGGGSAYVFLNYRSNILNQIDKQNQNQQNTITIEDKNISQKEKPLSIDITYPYIAGLDEFNKSVDELIQKEVNDFKKNSLENDEAVKKVDPESYAKYPRQYDLLISYEKGEIGQNVVSVVFDIYNFEGGAHGAHYFKSISYNPNPPAGGKKTIKLADVFPNRPDYLKRISDYCIADLTTQIKKMFGDESGAWIQEGAGPKEENYSVFLINKDNLVFYFSQYQIAPGAAGDFKVTVPKYMIMGMPN